MLRAEAGLRRGDTGAAHSRRRPLEAITAGTGSVDLAREPAQRAAELALRAGRPGDALAEVQRVLPLFTVPDLTISCGRLLAAGIPRLRRPGRAGPRPP